MKFETLDAWKRSVQLSVEVYKHFSDSRDFGFKDQITRSCLSIPSNIAEGLEKQSLKDQVRFIDYSKGSAAEFATQSIISTEIGYIDDQTSKKWLKKLKKYFQCYLSYKHTKNKNSNPPLILNLP